MTSSYNDNYFSSERLTFEKCHLQLMIISSYTEICSLHSKKNMAYCNKCMRFFGGRHYFFVVCLHSAIGDDLGRRFWERTFAWIWLVNSESRDHHVEGDFLPWYSKQLTSDWSITEESRENEAWKSHPNYWKSITKITWKCWTQFFVSDFA